MYISPVDDPLAAAGSAAALLVHVGVDHSLAAALARPDPRAGVEPLGLPVLLGDGEVAHHAPPLQQLGHRLGLLAGVARIEVFPPEDKMCKLSNQL